MVRTLQLVCAVWLGLPTATCGVRDGRAKRSQAKVVASVSAEGDLLLDEDADADRDTDTSEFADSALRLNSSMLAEVGGTPTLLEGYAIVNQNHLAQCYSSNHKGKPFPCEDGHNHACWATTRAAAMAWACGIKKPCLKAAELYLNAGTKLDGTPKKQCPTGGYFSRGMDARLRGEFEPKSGSGASAKYTYLTSGVDAFYNKASEHIGQNEAIVLAMGSSTASSDDVNVRCRGGNHVKHFVTVVGFVSGTKELVVYDPWTVETDATGTYRAAKNAVKAAKNKKAAVVHPNLVTALVSNVDGRIHLGSGDGLPYAKGPACILQALVVRQSSKKCVTKKQPKKKAGAPAPPDRDEGVEDSDEIDEAENMDKVEELEDNVEEARRDGGVEGQTTVE